MIVIPRTSAQLLETPLLDALGAIESKNSKGTEITILGVQKTVARWWVDNSEQNARTHNAVIVDRESRLRSLCYHITPLDAPDPDAGSVSCTVDGDPAALKTARQYVADTMYARYRKHLRVVQQTFRHNCIVKTVKPTRDLPINAYGVVQGIYRGGSVSKAWLLIEPVGGKPDKYAWVNPGDVIAMRPEPTELNLASMATIYAGAVKLNEFFAGLVRWSDAWRDSYLYPKADANVSVPWIDGYVAIEARQGRVSGSTLYSTPTHSTATQAKGESNG